MHHFLFFFCCFSLITNPVCNLTLRFNFISFFFCRCRQAIITIFIACGVLGLLIAFVNILIILVIVFSKKFHNSQAIYKVSLAAADALVGAVVLPLAVDILRRLVWTRHLPAGHIETHGYSIENGTINGNMTSVLVTEKAGQFRTKFPLKYENFAGFFTSVSIFVSVYTLAGAGFDRLRAVYNPLTYRKEKANKLAKRLCIASWLIAVLFGLLPLFTPNLEYALVLSITFATLDFNGLVLYSIGLFVPLLIVWGVNVFTFVFSKQHANFRRQLTQVAQRKRQKVETRLARTLQLMVAVFTLNTLPLVILLVSSFFLPSTRPSLPHQFDLIHGNMFIILEFIAVMLLFGNSLWNFLIYSYRNRDFRTAVKTGFRTTLKAICFSSFVDSIVLCFRSLAHSSRRRLSSIGSMPRSSIRIRKKSSLVTAITKISKTLADHSESGETVPAHQPSNISAFVSTQKDFNLPANHSNVTTETALTEMKKTNGASVAYTTF